MTADDLLTIAVECNLRRSINLKTAKAQPGESATFVLKLALWDAASKKSIKLPSRMGVFSSSSNEGSRYERPRYVLSRTQVAIMGA